MNTEGWRALKVLAIEHETTLNALAVEAFPCTHFRSFDPVSGTYTSFDGRR
jgi:hypothetical protein